MRAGGWNRWGHHAFLAALVATSIAAPRESVAQLSDGAIITPEFFEELYRIPAAGGSPIDLLDSPTFEAVPGDHLAIADEDTAYISYFADLYEFDFSAGQITLIDELSFTPQEITVNANGELIALAADEVFRIDTSTGDETSLYDEALFTPSDVVADDAGNLYMSEFFDALGVLSPGGVFTPIGNFDTDFFSHLDLGPDGMLYLSTTFGGSFYRVNPETGFGVELDSEVFTFIEDLQVDASGDILFAGEADAKTGVFRFDPVSQSLTSLADDTTVNGGFFNPRDIAIFSANTNFPTADFDADGDVDQGDLSQLLASYGGNNSGDTDGDNDTDGADLLAWQRQYTGGIGIQAAAVPEPTSVTLLLSMFITCCWRTPR